MDNINPCTTGNGENGWYVMCLKYRLNVVIVSNQKVGVYSRKTPKTGLFTFPGALFKSGPVGLQLSGYGIHFKKLTASISGSNFVGVHWISNVVNFVMQIKIPIPVQKIMPHTIEELKKRLRIYNDITIHR